MNLICFDRIGRKKAVIACLSARIVGMTIAITGPNYAAYAIGCFVMGIGTTSCYITNFILGKQLNMWMILCKQ